VTFTPLDFEEIGVTFTPTLGLLRVNYRTHERIRSQMANQVPDHCMSVYHRPRKPPDCGLFLDSTSVECWLSVNPWLSVRITPYTPNTPPKLPQYTPNTPAVHPQCTPHTPLTHPQYIPNTPPIHPSYTLNPPPMNPNTPSVHPKYTPNAPPIHFQCTPNTPCQVGVPAPRDPRHLRGEVLDVILLRLQPRLPQRPTTHRPPRHPT